MISSKIYSSIDQMEPQMKSSVAELLSQGKFLSLQWLKEKDRSSQQDVSYHLFFKTDHERPIGLIRPVVRLLNTSQKSFLQGLLTPSLQQKWLNIQSPGAGGQGFIFFPEYEDMAIGQVLKLINQTVKHDYDLIQLTVPQHLSFDFPYRAKMTKWTVYNTLHKNQENWWRLSVLPSSEKLRENIQQEERFFIITILLRIGVQ